MRRCEDKTWNQAAQNFSFFSILQHTHTHTHSPCSMINLVCQTIQRALRKEERSPNFVPHLSVLNLYFFNSFCFLLFLFLLGNDSWLVGYDGLCTSRHQGGVENTLIIHWIIGNGGCNIHSTLNAGWTNALMYQSQEKYQNSSCKWYNAFLFWQVCIAGITWIDIVLNQ